MFKKLVCASLVFALTLVFSMTASAGPAMDRILKRGELVVGTTGAQPPMTATNKKGEIIGLDAEISRAMAEALGVKVKFVSMPFNKLLPELEAGRVDMVLSGMTITPMRNKKTAFVGPYYVTGKGILAVAEKFAALKEATGLDTPEVTVAALKNSTSQKFAETMTPKAKLIRTKSLEEAVDLLFKEKVDVVIADFSFCAFTAYRHREKGMIAGASPLTFEPLGIAMAEDALLINWTRNFLTVLQGSGKIEEMAKKWLNGGPWIDELP